MGALPAVNRMVLRNLAWLLRRSPIKSGLTPIAFNRLTNRLIGTGPVPAKARTSGGASLHVDLNDHDGRILYLFGTNDRKVEATTKALLRAGDVFLDIGANHGSIGLAATAEVGRGGRVHFFEPQSRLADQIEAAIRALPTGNAVLHRIGLLDRDDRLTLRSPAHHSGMATFADTSTAGEAFDAAETCEVREVGGYLGPLVSDRPFGVKLDIEGAEPAVIPWLVAQSNLKFLICEIAQNAELIFDNMIRADMAVFGLVRDPLRLRFRRLRSFADAANFHDVLAVRLKADARLDRDVGVGAVARTMRD